MMENQSFRKLAAAAIAIILFLTLLPHYAFADGLSLAGSRSTDKTDMKIGDTFNLTYCITPQGTYTQRPPIDFGLVLDVSGSMGYIGQNNPRKTRMELLKESAKKLTASLRSADYGDRVGIVTFTTGARQVLGLTTDYDKADAKIDNLSPDSSTNIDDGLRLGGNMVKNSSGPKYLVLVSDGYANYYYDDRTGKNKYSLDRARKEAEEDGITLGRLGIPVFTIALASEDDRNLSDVDTELLRDIADASNGRAFTATNQEELNKAFLEIAKVASPSIQGIAAKQVFPAGFSLAGTVEGVSMSDHTLIFTRPDIPFNYDLSSYDCKVTVPMTYNGDLGTFTLDPATVDYTVGPNVGQAVIDDGITLKFSLPQDLSLTGSVGADNGNTPDYGNWNIADPFAMKFAIAPIHADSDGSGAITNGNITQTLPASVIPDTGQSGAALNSATHELTVAVPDFAYDGSTFNVSGFNPSVQLRFDHAGTYSFNPVATHQVSYTDNNGASQTAELNNTLPATVTVKVFLQDSWNNLYVGDGDGVVQRSSAMGVEMWSVDLGDQPIKAMSFAAGSNQSQILVTFADDSTQTLDLNPSAPTVELKDFDGHVINEGDTGYKKGAGTLALSGSAPKLPAATVYYDNAFQSGYVDHYEYRMKEDGIWGGWNSLNAGAIAMIDKTAQNLELEARAVTYSIAGDAASPAQSHAGDSALRTFSLDSDAPVIPGISGAFTPTDGQYNFTINGSITDQGSGLTADAKGEYFTIDKNGSPTVKYIDPAATAYTFTGTQAQLSSGSGIKVSALDKVGLATESYVNVPTDTTPPSIAFTPPTEQTDDPLLTVTATETESYIRTIKVWIDQADAGGAPDKDGGVANPDNPRSKTLAFKLSDVIQDDASKEDPKSTRYGWHKVIVVAENYAGTETSPITYYVKVNPGPIGTLAAVDYTGAKPANKPVTIIADYTTRMPVTAKYGKSAVDAKEMYYAITDSATRPDNASPEWKRLGAGQFVVSREGTSYVHLKLVDGDGFSSPTDDRMAQLKIRIDFNQNRY